MKRYWVIAKALVVVAILLVIKLIVDNYVLDVIVPSPVITALVAGVIFTMAAIFTGVLADYKESERIPGELASTFRNLYKDVRMATVSHPDLTGDMQNHIKQVLTIMNANFRRNEWRRSEINPAIDRLDEDIEHLAGDGIPPAYLVKIRAEMSTLEKLSYRIDTIMETSFIPAAYVIAVFANSAVILTLLFTKMDPYYEALALFGSVAFVLTSMLFLIRDMDNPFKFGGTSSVRVDMSILWRLEEQFENQK